MSEPFGFGPVGPSFRGQTWAARRHYENGDLADELLMARGVAREALSVSWRPLEDMADEYVLRAADIVVRAIQKNVHIVLFGDYDVDGTSSAAIMGRVLSRTGASFEVFIPDRIKDGYGLTPVVAARLVAQHVARGGNSLLVVMDSGTVAVEATEIVRSGGLAVVIIDHHPASGAQVSKPHVLINPKVAGSLELQQACAAGLSAVLASVVASRLGIHEERGAIEQLACVATIADIVDLFGFNRSVVLNGLASLNRGPISPLAALLEVSRRKSNRIVEKDIGFLIGPRINAAGRLKSGMSAAALLMSDDEALNIETASELDRLNGDRQSLETKALDEAADAVAGNAVGSVGGLLSADWHVGIVGLVASRLVERFSRPFLIGSVVGDYIKGSGRSHGGFDLGGAVVAARLEGFLSTGGGHRAACGFSCRPELFDDFVAFVSARFDAGFEPFPDLADLSCDARVLTLGRWESVEALHPFGCGFPEPVVLAHGAIRGSKDFRGGTRIWLEQSELDVVVFDKRVPGLGGALAAQEGSSVTLIGNVAPSEFNGQRRLSMMVSDAILGG